MKFVFNDLASVMSSSLYVLLKQTCRIYRYNNHGGDAILDCHLENVRIAPVQSIKMRNVHVVLWKQALVSVWIMTVVSQPCRCYSGTERTVWLFHESPPLTSLIQRSSPNLLTCAPHYHWIMSIAAYISHGSLIFMTKHNHSSLPFVQCVQCY